MSSDSLPHDKTSDPLQLEKVVAAETLQALTQSCHELFGVPMRLFSATGSLLAEKGDQAAICALVNENPAGRRACAELVGQVKRAGATASEPTTIHCFTGARYQTFIAWEVGCAPYEVEAMVLGGHGDSMVPLPRLTAVNGTALDELLPPEKIAEIVARTRNGGAEIVSHLKTGSAFYAPSAAVADMVKAIARNEHRVIPCAVQLQGEYGLGGLFLGVPCRLGATGVEEVVEIYLTEEETAALHASAQHVRETVAAWENLPKG
jgi:hypothetical protein